MIYEGTDHLDLVWVVTTCTKKSIYINDPVVTQWLEAFQLQARQAIEHTHKCKSESKRTLPDNHFKFY